MSDIRDEVDAIIDDRPETHRVFTEILHVDTEHSVWTFEDIEADTGLFGELVSRGIVEKQDDGYSLADPTAVDAALAHRDGGDDVENVENAELATDGSRSDISETVSDGNSDHRHLNTRLDDSVDLLIEAMPTDRSRILPVVGALALVVIFRLVAVGNVFQQGYVVLVGNDPYYYRHHLIDFVAANRGPLTLAEGVKQGEPLFIITLQIITAIFGGSFVAAGQVLAWYPIGAAVICGICVYLLGTRLTDDRRVGLASVAILATLPAHASRTGLGFADHHTLDVLIVALVLTTVAAYERTSPTSVSELQRLAPLVILAGVGIGAQTLAWNAGALLLTPLGVYGFIRALASIRQDIPVLYRLTPLTASAAIGGGIAVLAHEIFGWQSAMMIVPPAILATALFILAIVTEGFRRIGLDYRTSAVGIITSGLIITVTGFELIPRFNEEFTEQLSRLSSAPQENIFEAQSLLSNDFGFILAPLIFFGLAFFVSSVVVAWGSRVGWECDRGDCLLICVYWIMLLLFSLLQVRFAIHLALPMSILTGVSLVWLISKVTEVTPPYIRTVGCKKQSVTERRATWRSRSVNVDDQSSIQDANPEQINRRQVITAGVTLFMLIGGLGAVIAPVQAGEIAYDDDTIRAIDQINDFVASENQTLSETYVFSLWGNNRMYNAHVNNNSEKFGYAQNNFISFLRSSDTEEWYDRMQSRVGFIIIPEITEFSELDSDTVYARLHDRQGLGTHYQLLYAGDEKKAYAVVPGTMVNGTVNEAKTSVTVSGRMDVGSRTMITQREIPTEDGSYTIRIATPGTYTIGNRTVEVTQEDVVAG